MFNKPSREFQPGLKADERRRVRQDERLRLRRADRESRLQKKRNKIIGGSSDNANSTQSSYSQNASQPNQVDQMRKQQMLQQLPQYVKGCYSDHPATQFECTQRIRKLLSIEREPPIKAVIDSGVVTRLIQFLQFDQYDRLQFEAAWALTNIASGTAENTAVVIRYGAVPIFVRLLQSKSAEVQEQAIWALGNIAGDSPECRNLVLKHGGLSGLLPICCPSKCQTQQQVTLLRNATWTLSNFCRGKPQPEWKYIQLALRALTQMITCDDDEILQDTCWAFSYLSDTDDEASHNNNGTQQMEQAQQLRAITDCGGLAYLVQLLEHSSPHVRHPALRTIGNIVTGSDDLTQKVLNLGVLKKLQRLLLDQAPIKREACWTISNITAGSKEQIEAVISANLFPPLIQVLKTERYEISKEALWAISNATSGGSDVQVSFLVHQGVIPPLCNFLKLNTNNSRARILMVALEGIDNILAVGQRRATNGVNMFATYVEECNGIDYLEQLQSNQEVVDEIYDKAAKIIKEYFNGEETNAFMNGDMNMNDHEQSNQQQEGMNNVANNNSSFFQQNQPSQQQQNMFAFGLGQNQSQNGNTFGGGSGAAAAFKF